MRVVATGCYATRAAEDLADLSGVTAIVPNPDKPGLVSRVLADLASHPTTAERFGGEEGACGAPLDPYSFGRTTATLRVQTGCDQKCSYCIIPSTRGGGRSKALGDVLAEATRLDGEGFKEAALTGVHIGSYGRDLDPSTNLHTLLCALDEHPSSLMFRLSSLEPMDCTTAIVDLVAGSGRFAPHFHLPLQSASDRLLQGMRRPYTLADYDRLVSGIRRRLPDAGIGSDFVVGFPGEGPEDIEINLEYLAGSPLTYLHVFPYSDRPGTEAAGMSRKVPGAEVRARARLVRERGAQLTTRFRATQVGSVRHALTIDGGRIALTDNYLKVWIHGTASDNQRVRVRITGAGTLTDPMTGALE